MKIPERIERDILFNYYHTKDESVLRHLWNEICIKISLIPNSTTFTNLTSFNKPPFLNPTIPYIEGPFYIDSSNIEEIANFLQVIFDDMDVDKILGSLLNKASIKIFKTDNVLLSKIELNFLIFKYIYFRSLGYTSEINALIQTLETTISDYKQAVNLKIYHVGLRKDIVDIGSSIHKDFNSHQDIILYQLLVKIFRDDQLILENSREELESYIEVTNSGGIVFHGLQKELAFMIQEIYNENSEKIDKSNKDFSSDVINIIAQIKDGHNPSSFKNGNRINIESLKTQATRIQNDLINIDNEIKTLENSQARNKRLIHLIKLKEDFIENKVYQKSKTDLTEFLKQLKIIKS